MKLIQEACNKEYSKVLDTPTDEPGAIDEINAGSAGNDIRGVPTDEPGAIDEIDAGSAGNDIRGVPRWV